MNPTTQQVIEFLTHPELPFGAEEDVLLLSDPESLHLEVASLLKKHLTVLGEANSEELRARLAQADWPLVAQEFQARIEMASRLFDTDAQTPTNT